MSATDGFLSDCGKAVVVRFAKITAETRQGGDANKVEEDLRPSVIMSEKRFNVIFYYLCREKRDFRTKAF